MTHLLLEYTLSPHYLEGRSEFRDAHIALLQACADRGELILAGALTDPWDKALLVWREGSHHAIERFLAADPYVAHGLVESWHVRNWNTVVGSAIS